MIIYSVNKIYKNFILRQPTSSYEDYIVPEIDKEHYLNFMNARYEWFLQQDREKINIYTKDNIKLFAQLVDFGNPKNLIICFHTIDGKGETDFAPCAKLFKETGFNMLVTDSRAHGESEGDYRGFGFWERLDVLQWVSYAVNRFGDDVNIFLYGVSTGAATVLMSSCLDLPENVKGIISDCAFSSVDDIFTYFLKHFYHLPRSPIIPAAELYLKKKLNLICKDASALDAVSKTNIPILFIHGGKDTLVPTAMAYELYDACSSKKELLIIDDATHAKSHYFDSKRYEEAVSAFIKSRVKA